jgi:hypothetical protein
MQEANPSNSGVLRIRIQPSRTLTIALILAHAGAGAALLLQQGPWWVAAGLIGVLLASASVSVRRYARGGRRRVHELLLRADGGFDVLTATGSEAAALTYVSVAEPWLTVFGVRAASGRRHDIVLLGDNVEAEPFRRLRVRLRESGQPGFKRAGVAPGGAAAGDAADPEPRRPRGKDTRSRSDTP